MLLRVLIASSNDGEMRWMMVQWRMVLCVCVSRRHGICLFSGFIGS